MCRSMMRKGGVGGIVVRVRVEVVVRNVRVMKKEEQNIILKINY